MFLGYEGSSSLLSDYFALDIVVSNRASECLSHLDCLLMMTILSSIFQLHSLEKNGAQITKWVSYCANHKYEMLTFLVTLI